VGQYDFSINGTPPWSEPLFDRTGPPEPVPQPVLPLWNGLGGPMSPQEYDPAFVGETLIAIGASVSVGYRDYRLTPGSPMMDLGKFWPANRFLNGETYREEPCPNAMFLDWDGEGYGNNRKVGEVDVGFDEVELVVLAGSYANYDNSHNAVPTASGAQILNKAIVQGQANRQVLFPASFSGTGTTVSLLNAQHTIFGTERIPTGTNPPLPIHLAWTSQPGTPTTPILDGSAQAPFDKQWIDFNLPQPSFMSSWPGAAAGQPFGYASFTDRSYLQQSGGAPNTGQPTVQFLFQPWTPYVTDSEGSPYAAWFNTQFRVLASGAQKFFLSNCQSEYR
jgi:hypothetical protein